MRFERLKNIEFYLSENHYASIDELLENFEISIQTLRRDLNELEKRNIITKVYGGVLYNRNSVSSKDYKNIDNRRDHKLVDKVKIGRLASQFVESNDVIFIDSGTTAIHIIPYLDKVKNVLIVTHSLDVVNEVAKHPQLTCILIGGKLQQSTNSFYTDTKNFNYNFNKAFISTVGISLPKGLSNFNFYEASIKRAVIENSSNVFVLVDDEKFDVISLNNFATYKSINTVITNKEPNKLYLDTFRRFEIKVIF